MTAIPALSPEVTAIKDDTIALRRAFHQYPELAFEEKRTAELIAERLRALGLAVEQEVGVTGVVAVLESTRPGKTLMIRADMDALPMAEIPGRPYGSRIENRNHACGHDMNMALVLSTAEVLARHREKIVGRVAFVFQPADEPQTGAKRMIEDGLLEKVQPDMVLSHHPLPAARAGQVVVQSGTVWTSIDTMKLIIQGKGGWFAARDESVDCALIAAELITTLYPAVHRESPLAEPVLFSVSTVQGSTRPGTILPQVELTLSLAVYDLGLRRKLLQRLDEITNAVVTAMGGSWTQEILHSLPPAINDPTVTSAVLNAAKQVVGEENIIRDWRNIFPDDIALFMERVPGCMFMLGTANPAKGIVHNWHTPGFDIDEDTLPIGVEIMSRAALDLLG